MVEVRSSIFAVRSSRSRAFISVVRSFVFISLMLRGKKQGFEKVIKLIDNLVVTLGKEQTDDDAQRTWCTEEFDSSDDSEKDLKRRISGFETRITENEEGIAPLTDELAALKKGIKELDVAV